MEQMKSQCSTEEAKMNLTRSIAKMMALGWYEYEQAREELAKPSRIEEQKRMSELYEQMVKEGQEEIHRLKGGP